MNKYKSVIYVHETSVITTMNNIYNAQFILKKKKKSVIYSHLDCNKCIS